MAIEDATSQQYQWKLQSPSTSCKRRCTFSASTIEHHPTPATTDTRRCITAATLSTTTFSDLPEHLQSLILAQAHAPLDTCKMSAAIVQDPQLLDSGPVPSRQSTSGSSPHNSWLAATASGGNLHLLQHALAAGPPHSGHLKAAFLKAFRGEHIQALGMLLQCKDSTGAGISAHELAHAFTSAAWAGNLPACELLAQRGADIRACVARLKLHGYVAHAGTAKHWEALKFMLHHGRNQMQAIWCEQSLHRIQLLPAGFSNSTVRGMSSTEPCDQRYNRGGGTWLTCCSEQVNLCSPVM
jgi:hypothetical protein